MSYDELVELIKYHAVFFVARTFCARYSTILRTNQHETMTDEKNNKTAILLRYSTPFTFACFLE